MVLRKIKRSRWAIFKQYLLASPSAAIFVEMCVKNPFFWALAVVSTALCIITSAAVHLPPLSATGVPICIFITLVLLLMTLKEPLKKWLLCEVSLMGSTICQALKKPLISSLLPACASRAWYTEITDKLTLGAIPLKNRNHHHLLKKEGYTAFLSLVEDFETLPHLFGYPIVPEYWEMQGCSYLNLPSPDCTPVHQKILEKAIAFVHQQISQGKRVYVHCNAGVARSATVVICYLIHFHQMAMHDAVAFVKAKRWIAVDHTSPALSDFTEIS